MCYLLEQQHKEINVSDLQKLSRFFGGVLQDCDRRKERGLAPQCGERIHSDETRGERQGAEHL